MISKGIADDSIGMCFSHISGKGTRSDAAELSRKATHFGADISWVPEEGST